MDIPIKNRDIYIYIYFLYFSSLTLILTFHHNWPLYNARNIIPGEDSEGWKVIKRFVRFDPDDTQRQKAVREVKVARRSLVHRVASMSKFIITPNDASPECVIKVRG